MFGIGTTELMVILILALIILGPKKLPELAKSLGRSMSELRRVTDELRETVEEEMEPLREELERIKDPTRQASIDEEPKRPQPEKKDQEGGD